MLSPLGMSRERWQNGVPMPISKNPTYNLKAVLHETGLKPDVLRAWERRYGIPAPERTQGGHRLYSEFDMALLKWLVARQAEGLSISRAVEMWKEVCAPGQEMLIESALTTVPAMVKPLQPMQMLSGQVTVTSLDGLRTLWLEACMAYNEIAADKVLNQAFSLYPIEQVCTGILQHGMAEIGMLWYENRASVQQEHFASALAMRRLDTLIAASPAPTRNQTILIGCPADEWHTFTPLMLTLFLRRRGLIVIYLGANVPANRFEETIRAVHADLVILSSQQLSTASTLQQTAMLLASHGGNVAFGGRIFNTLPNIVKSIPAHFLGHSLDAAIWQIESLLAFPKPAPKVTTQPTNYAEILEKFILKRPSIESTLNEALAQPGFDQAYLVTANQFMGNDLIAALQLGDVSYIDSELDWLTAMIKGNQLDLKVLSFYLRAYASALEQHLGAAGQPVVEWLIKRSQD